MSWAEQWVACCRPECSRGHVCSMSSEMQPRPRVRVTMTVLTPGNLGLSSHYHDQCREREDVWHGTWVYIPITLRLISSPNILKLYFLCGPCVLNRRRRNAALQPGVLRCPRLRQCYLHAPDMFNARSMSGGSDLTSHGSQCLLSSAPLVM